MTNDLEAKINRNNYHIATYLITSAIVNSANFCGLLLARAQHDTDYGITAAASLTVGIATFITAGVYAVYNHILRRSQSSYSNMQPAMNYDNQYSFSPADYGVRRIHE